MILQDSILEMGVTTDILKESKDWLVTFGVIKSQEGEILEYGCGNGKLHDIKFAGEAIEHFYYGQPDSTQQVTLRQITDQPEFEKDGVLRKLDQSQLIRACTFQTLVGKDRDVLVPANWCIPIKKEERGSIPHAFRSSSGFSYGLNLNMAIDHSILELVERHVFSKILIACDKGNTSFIHPVIIESELTAKIEKEFNGKLCFFRAADFGVSVAIVLFFPNDETFFPLPQTATKAALSFDEAFDGAMNEMRQILFLYDDEVRREDLDVIEDVSFVNRHRPSVYLRPFAEAYNTCKLNGSKKPQTVSPLRPCAANVNEVISNIQSDGYSPLIRIAKQFRSGAVVVQIFIAGFEKYNLVRLGSEVPIHSLEFM